MTMSLLDRGATPSSVSSAQWLRETTAAVRVSFTWFGVRKTLTNEQKNQAAESFGAEGEYLSARKKLLDDIGRGELHHLEQGVRRLAATAPVAQVSPTTATAQDLLRVGVD